MHIHILGICGTFMGGLAILARQLGHEVTGSDANVYPPMSTQLEAQGIALTEGYDPAQLEPRPDLVVIGKGLSAGLPLAAVAAGDRFLGYWPSGMHTSTFQGNPLACAMAVATIDTIWAEKLLDHVKAIATDLMTHLQPLVGRHGVSALRIVGAQAAIVFCNADGQPDLARSELIQRRMLLQHILVYGGGREGECVMLVPPLNLSCKKLHEALKQLVTQIEQTA